MNHTRADTTENVTDVAPKSQHALAALGALGFDCWSNSGYFQEVKNVMLQVNKVQVPIKDCCGIFFVSAWLLLSPLGLHAPCSMFDVHI